MLYLIMNCFLQAESIQTREAGSAEQPEPNASALPEPSSSGTSREELAPGTPAQQSPPVLNVHPGGGNLMSPLFTFPPQRHQMHPQVGGGLIFRD